jgi:azurin
MKKTLALLFLSTSLLIGCGGEAKKSEEKQGIKINSSSSSNEKVKEEGISEVYLSGNDQMKYNKSQITVSAGDEVVLTFEHVGKLPKESMGHNFVLLKKGTNVQEFGQEALEYKDNDYIPEDSDVIIVHTEMLGGGQKTTITFQAPEKGDYDFICSFPGHVALMNGIFTVE